MRSVRTAVFVLLSAAVAVVVSGCASPTANSGAANSDAASALLESSPPESPASSATPWGAQDGTFSAARAIPCGPKPHGANAGLARELADSHRYDNTPYPGPPTTPPTPPTPPPSQPSPPPVPGQFELTDLTLVPPPADTKPAACADVALDALRSMPEGVGSAQPAKVWLAIMSAPRLPHESKPTAASRPISPMCSRGSSTSTICHRCARPDP